MYTESTNATAKVSRSMPRKTIHKRAEALVDNTYQAVIDHRLQSEFYRRFEKRKQILNLCGKRLNLREGWDHRKDSRVR